MVSYLVAYLSTFIDKMPSIKHQRISKRLTQHIYSLFMWPKGCIVPSSLNNCIEVLLLMLLIAQIMIILRSEPMKIKRQFQRDI